jgi:outer membrane biosynthesis protein TonB
VAVHVAVFAFMVWGPTSERPPFEFISYQIELVSAPASLQAAEPEAASEELVVERPEVELELGQEVVVEERAEPEPEPEPPAPPETPEPEPEPQEPAEQADPSMVAAPEAPKGGDAVNVRLEGVRRDYPLYYNNIIRQIQRCFQWSGQGGWETTVYFVINRDGSVSDLDFVKRSGNPQFDLSAMGAAECAGGRGRFGALPEDLPFDRLPIQFKFVPPRGS